MTAVALAAGESTVSDDGKSIVFRSGTAPPKITISTVGGDHKFVASAGVLNAGKGCKEDPVNTVTCVNPRPVQIFGGAGIDTITSTVTVGLTAELGAGNDWLDSSDGSDRIDAGPGDDRVGGDEGNDVISGNTGNDTLGGYTENDNLDGGPGNDSLDGGPGSDLIAGGADVDTVNYSSRTKPVTLSIGSGVNDGEANERDDVKVDVENAFGGAAGDKITGSAGPNSISSGAGNDTVDGAGGNDLITAGTGNDKVLARDGVGERIDCGDGTDTAVIDEVDVPFGCENVDKSSALQPDADKDGVQTPTDCNDADPGIRPGATDTPADGIDQDCSGADASRQRVGSTVNSGFRVFRRTTQVVRLQVRDIPAGATVELRCRGSRCPFRTRRQTFTSGLDSKSFQSKFRKRKFRPGVRIEVRITQPDAIGRVLRYTVRRRKAPRVSRLCLAPGSRSPSRSC